MAEPICGCGYTWADVERELDEYCEKNPDDAVTSGWDMVYGHELSCKVAQAEAEEARDRG